MDIKKTIGIAAVAAMLLGALAGCSTTGGDTTSKPAEQKPAATEQLTGTVNLTVSGSDTEIEAGGWIETEEAAFEKTQPGLTINWKNITINEGDTGTTIPKDPSTAPNVYMFAQDQLGALVKANAIGELSTTGVDQIKKQNAQNVIDSVTYNGKQYGIPFTGNTWFMYYNKSKITDPTDLDAMLKQGVVSFPMSNSWNSPAFYMGAGATLFGADGTDETAAPTGFDNVDVTTYLVNLMKNPNYFEDDGSGAAKNGLKDGSVDVFFSGTWDGAEVKTDLGDNFAVTIDPSFTVNGTKYQMKPFAGSKDVAYNPAASSDPTTQKAAALFAMFLGDTDSQLTNYKLSGTVPSDTSLATNADIAADPVAQAQYKQMDPANSVLQPVWPAMNNAFWAPFTTFSTNIVNGTITVDNAAQQVKDNQAAMVAGMKG
jgi:arabinogalactan oligomer/maltooligosaccharide transport system substrate-binding protein